MKKKELKITLIREEYRLNFVYDGKHYTINQHEDGYEHYVGMHCLDDPDFHVFLGYDSFSIHDYLPTYESGQAYKHIDVSKLYELVEKYI